MITLSQLRAFAAVARHGHFTRAAEELQIAQPSVSYQIDALERALRVTLVEVVGRRVYLTPAGEHLASRAAALVNDADDIEREMRDYATGSAGRLRIGATRTVGGYALPEILATFSAAYPGIEIQLIVDNTSVIERLLLAREIDLGVVEWRVQSPEIQSQPLREDAMVLVVSPSHPLAKRESIQREDLRGQRVIWRESGSGTRALAEDALGPIAATLVTVLEIAEPEAIVRAVEAGLGVTFISESIVARQLAAGSLVALTIRGLTLVREFSIVTLRQRPDPQALRAFRTMITEAWASS